MHAGKTAKSRILSVLVFSLFFALFILTNKAGFYSEKNTIYDYFFSYGFVLEFSIFTAFSFAVLIISRKYTHPVFSVRADKLFTAVIVVLAVSVILLAPVRFTRPYLTGIYGIVTAIFIFIFRLPVIKNEKRSAAAPGQADRVIDGFAFLAALSVFIMLFCSTAFFHMTFSTQAVDMGIFTNLIWQEGNNGSQYTWFEGFVDH
jgi:hypothetical protein